MSVPTKKRNGLRVYGAWSGNPQGTLEDVTRCAEEVWSGGRSLTSHQCNRKRRPGSIYCAQHEPEAVKKRQAETEKRSEERWRRRRIRDALGGLAYLSDKTLLDEVKRRGLDARPRKRSER